MSLEKSFADLLAPLIASLEANTAAMGRVAGNQERLIAGQEAAIAKIEAGKGADDAKPRRRRNSSAQQDAEPEQPSQPEPEAQVHPLLSVANGETRKNDKGADEPTAKYRAASFDRVEVKNEFIGWLGETSDIDERKRRAAFVGEIAQHFGVSKPFDPQAGISDPEHLKQTLFFLRRKREGLSVNFSADYDFDGDPLADQTPDGGDDDALDALG